MPLSQGGERGPFYPVFERSELSAELGYATTPLTRGIFWALSQSCLLEAKSENGVLKNQQLVRINFPVFGDLRQSRIGAGFAQVGKVSGVLTQHRLEMIEASGLGHGGLLRAKGSPT